MDVCHRTFHLCQSEQLATCCETLYNFLDNEFDHIVCFYKQKCVIFRFWFRRAVCEISVTHTDNLTPLIVLKVAKVQCYANTVNKIVMFLRTWWKNRSYFCCAYLLLDVFKPLLVGIWSYDKDKGETGVFNIQHYSYPLTIVVNMVTAPTISYEVTTLSAIKAFSHTVSSISDVCKILSKYIAY